MKADRLRDHEEARRRLLEDGTPSFLDAVTALIAYRSEVQKRCRQVVESGLKEYSLALKVTLTRDDVVDAAWPSVLKWEGDWWSLGVEIKRNNIPGVRWWEAVCYLQYERGENGLFCWFGERLPNRKLAAHLFGKFHQENQSVMHEDKEVWLQHGLQEGEIASLDELLEGLFQQWIGIWRKVGGIAEAFKDFR